MSPFFVSVIYYIVFRKITSPYITHNTFTIVYQNHSRLPLQWILLYCFIGSLLARYWLAIGSLLRSLWLFIWQSNLAVDHRTSYLWLFFRPQFESYRVFFLCDCLSVSFCPVIYKMTPTMLADCFWVDYKRLWVLVLCSHWAGIFHESSYSYLILCLKLICTL